MLEWFRVLIQRRVYKRLMLEKFVATFAAIPMSYA